MSPGGPIFIVGAMGSGTTLMRLMLDSHDDIAVPQETGIMRAVQAQKWIPYWNFGDKWYPRLGVDEKQLDVMLGEFYGQMFERYAAERGKVRWGEKTPWHVWHMQQITQLWPDAVFVAMVRHPGGNVGSLMTRFTYETDPAVYHWARYNRELLRQAGALGKRFALCRYEDLVLDPQRTMRELLDWLGEPWSPKVLEHHNVQKDQGGPSKVEGRTRSDDPIDVDRVLKWTSVLDGDSRRSVSDKAGPLMRFFGYSMDDPERLTPLAESGSGPQAVVDGPALTSRLRDFSDVDLSDPAETPLADGPLNPRKVTLRRKPPAAPKS